MLKGNAARNNQIIKNLARNKKPKREHLDGETIQGAVKKSGFEKMSYLTDIRHLATTEGRSGQEG